jgi:uncharacterized protein YbjT (DUF2867 family)
MHRVLVLGGYGVFGRRAVERLAREAGLEVIVAGRSASAAERMARETADTPSSTPFASPTPTSRATASAP